MVKVLGWRFGGFSVPAFRVLGLGCPTFPFSRPGHIRPDCQTGGNTSHLTELVLDVYRAHGPLHPFNSSVNCFPPVATLAAVAAGLTGEGVTAAAASPSTPSPTSNTNSAAAAEANPTPDTLNPEGTLDSILRSLHP